MITLRQPSHLPCLGFGGHEERWHVTNLHAMVSPARRREPRVPLAVADAPTQRFYAAALFVGVEVWKYSRIAAVHLLGATPHAYEPVTLFRALLLDFALLYALWWLAIPTGTEAADAAVANARARRPLTAVHYAAAFVGLGILNVALLGRDTHLGPTASAALSTVLSPVLALAGLDAEVHLGLGERRMRVRDVVQPSVHLSGQHTIHILPYGTARLAPARVCQCLGTDVTLPVYFNQTVPALLQYSVTDVVHGNRSVFQVKAPKTRTVAPPPPPGDAAPDVPGHAQGLSLRERKWLRQAAKERAKSAPDAEVVHDLVLSQPGLVRLEAVHDKHGNAARLTATDVLLVACPEASFAAPRRDYCPGDEGDLSVDVRGLAPLELVYAHTSHGKTSQHVLSQLAGAATGDRVSQRLGALERLTPDALQFARATSLSLPLALDLGAPGSQTFALASVRDACGNLAPLHGTSEVTVHPRAAATFDAQVCTPGRPLKLLRNTSGVALPITVGSDQAWDAEVQYTPRDGVRPEWTRSLSIAGRGEVQATAPGTYALTALHGPHCAGTIGAPWTCEVVDVPPPKADIHFESIEDPCAGTVGVKALSVLEGEPPFRLTYEVQRQGQPPRRQVRVVEQQTRDELEFWPSTEGLVTYKFLALDDANYRQIALDGPTFTQVVHPLADAAFTARGSGNEAVVRSCGKAQADAEVALSGHGPWELTYSVRGGKASEQRTVHIDAPNHTLHVDLPPDVQKNARATISLERLRDGKGCERRLATRDLRIDVSHTRPTIGFLPGGDVPRVYSVRDGATARLPLRLAGDAPWRVSYTHRSAPDAAPAWHEVVVNSANDFLDVTKPGLYTLQTLRDAHCEGDVLSPQHTFNVTVRPRPQAAFGLAAGRLASNGSALREAVCIGTQDAAPMQLQGYAPVTVRYLHHAPGRAGDARTFATSQTAPPLTLATDAAGWHTYEITDVGDALYSSAGISAGIGPQRLEQMVYPQAHAAFATHKVSAAFCVGDTLHGALPAIELQGTPPFTLGLSLRPAATSAQPAHAALAYTFTRVVSGQKYTPRLESDEFVFGASGAWTLSLDHVSDAHGCRASLRSAPLALEVVETAGIAPASARTDYCVGEEIDYMLQGMSPWTVRYSFNGKELRATSRTAEFSRTADEPGVLVMHSAAHQQNQCRSTRAATSARIHALPSAQVSSGKHRVESLHQGRHAEIIFTLRGEPPFAFTYQRTEPVDTHTHPKVLETHTVERVDGTEYRIQTTQEGTWSVVWIQDQWCQVSLGEASGPSTWRA